MTGQSDSLRKRRRQGRATSGSGAERNAGNSSDRSSSAETTANDSPRPDGATTPNDQNGERSEVIRSFLIRAVIFTLLMYFNPLSGRKDDKASSDINLKATVPESVNTPSVSGGDGQSSIFSAFMPSSTGQVPAYYKRILRNSWRESSPCELRIFVSEEVSLAPHDIRSLDESPAWALRGLTYDKSESNVHSANITLAVPDSVRTGNGSWFAHAFFSVAGAWDEMLANASIDDFSQDNSILYHRHNLVKWVKKKSEEKSLLGDDTDSSVVLQNTNEQLSNQADANAAQRNPSVGDDDDKILQMWKPTMAVEVVADTSDVVLGQVPANVAEQYKVKELQGVYLPLFFVNEFWTLREHLRTIDEESQSITVEMSFHPVSMTKWTMLKSMEGMWKNQEKLGLMEESNIEDMKRMFIETNPILLGTTMLVSLAHTVLETLAFKSDITHWRNLQSLEGVSVRSMFWQIGMQVIVLLYLLDNDTSWMITIGNAFGILLEVWKLKKAVKIKSFGKKKLFGVLPWFELEHAESYTSTTKEYDDEAMRYMTFLLYPCVAAYALYSLKFEKHKSWYSWIVGSLVGAVYSFGFLMMLPQVIINHRLKSVAHMPLKSFCYKALNTVIDDLFSFVIKMPWLHRLACFRDDVIFVVFLYQYWKYPVDKTRVNEFGQRGTDFDSNASESNRPSSRESSAENVSAKPSVEKKRD